MLGEALGPYRLERELGSGGMGSVYLGRAEDGTAVAVKVVHAHLLEKPGYLDRFLREVRVGKQVDHENVVHTLDAGTAERNGTRVHYLVMEHVDGKTLRELAHELGTIPEGLLREIGRQVAAGLEAIHAANVIHRDLKPENVVIASDEHVRIMDLGVARLQQATVELTPTGQFAGSVLYGAPEQFKRDPLDSTADLYSLGVTLYELAVGKNPFVAEDVRGVIRAHLEHVPDRADRLRPELSAFFAEVLATLMEKDQTDRFASAADLKRALILGERSEWWSGREAAALESRERILRIQVRRETEIYGRNAENEQLEKAWAHAREGGGRMVLIEGEAGIGKTRLVDAFLNGLREEQAHVLYGSYPPAGGMGGLSDAVTQHFGTVALESGIRPYLTTMPGLAAPFARMVQHDTSGGETIRGDALHAAFVELMRGLAAERPLVWVVDDLHFASRDSRQLVLSMARALAGHPVLLVATTRPGIPDDEVANFSRCEGFLRLPVGRLSPREVISLLRDAFQNQALAEKLGGKVAYKSDGVPFFVFEIIRGLEEGQFIKALPDGSYIETKVIEEIQVPSAVRDLIEARLGDVSDEDRQLLDVASVQGFEFDPDLIARVWETKRVVVLGRLAAIERRCGLIQSEGDLCRFDHHQIQEVIYADIMDALRREYHALLAAALVERDGIDPDDAEFTDGETAVFLTRHALRSNEQERALPYLMRALGHLKSGYRNDERAEVLHRALGAPGLLTGVARVNVLVDKSDLLYLRGDSIEQEPVLAEALELAEDCGDPIALFETVKARGHYLRHVGDFQGAHGTSERLLEIATEMGDARRQASALGGLGLACSGLARYEDARRHQERSIDLCTQLEDEFGALIAQGNLVNVLMNLGEAKEALAVQRRSVERWDEIGDPMHAAIASGTLGSVCHTLGRFEESLACYRRALEGCRAAGARRNEGIVYGLLGISLLGLGRLGEAMHHFEAGRLLARESGTPMGEAIDEVNIGSLLLTLGADDEAREHLAVARRICEEAGRTRVMTYVLGAYVQLAERSGDLEESLRVAREALEYARDIGYAAGIPVALAKSGRFLVDLGRFDEAREVLEEAIGLATEQENPAGVLAALHLGRLPGADMAAAVAIWDAHADEVDLRDVVEARYTLWQLTDDANHLEEARRVLFQLRDNAPERYRKTILENVPVHRAVLEAWRAGNPDRA